MCWLIPYAITDPDQKGTMQNMRGALFCYPRMRCENNGELANQNQQVNDGPEK